MGNNYLRILITYVLNKTISSTNELKTKNNDKTTYSIIDLWFVENWYTKSNRNAHNSNNNSHHLPQPMWN